MILLPNTVPTCQKTAVQTGCTTTTARAADLETVAVSVANIPDSIRL